MMISNAPRPVTIRTHHISTKQPTMEAVSAKMLRGESVVPGLIDVGVVDEVGAVGCRTVVLSQFHVPAREYHGRFGRSHSSPLHR